MASDFNSLKLLNLSSLGCFVMTLTVWRCSVNTEYLIDIIGVLPLENIWHCCNIVQYYFNNLIMKKQEPSSCHTF